ncbi:hypothetical protein ABZ721_08470 [Streptomyces sp. NPDC006733]|uniref:hypothetical protein n=1 Tax=Streptomyces sp. NPDC006733 TaxID=3155460 RepID=UPI0033C79ADE
MLTLNNAGHAIVAVTRQCLVHGVEDSPATWPHGDARTVARLLLRFVEQGPLATAPG